jgi:3-oxoacyl-(acyl-carrier-protein) synthase
MTALIGRNLKYFPRMTTEIRQLLAAASLAIQAVGWSDPGDRHIGILGCGYGGVLRADVEYFRDYVAQGRTIGRGNLFIYTLPTSALSEVAIALGLTGPTLHLHEATDAPQALIKHATRLIEIGEADGMVCVWHEGATARCVAIGI